MSSYASCLEYGNVSLHIAHHLDWDARGKDRVNQSDVAAIPFAILVTPLIPREIHLVRLDRLGSGTAVCARHL